MATAAPPICPHCGYDLMADRPIERDGIRLHPATQSVWWHGVERALSPAQFVVLRSLVKAAPTFLSTGTLAERLGYDGDAPRRLIYTVISTLRYRLPDAPIMTIWSRGYAWRPAGKEPA